MLVRNATLSVPAGLVSYLLVNYSQTCHSKLRQISSKMCISVSNRTERKGTPVDRNLFVCSFLQFFFPPQNSPVVLAGWLRKGYVPFLVWNVGVHNDVDLHSPSPSKAFLSSKTRLGFTVFTCLSFKQIHKNVYISHPRIRIYKIFMLFVTVSAFL